MEIDIYLAPTPLTGLEIFILFASAKGAGLKVIVYEGALSVRTKGGRSVGGGGGGKEGPFEIIKTYWIITSLFTTIVLRFVISFHVLSFPFCPFHRASFAVLKLAYTRRLIKNLCPMFHF